MPIDLLPVTSTWLAAFEAHRRHIIGVAGILERWLHERADRMAVLERRTRAFPVFAFEGRALSVTIDAQQHRALQPYRNAGAAWAAPFVAFGRGFTRIPQAVEDELILPNALGLIEGLFALVGDSVNRLVDPRPGTFDPANARLSDVFGLFAMAWRGLTTSTGQLRLLVRDIGLAKQQFATPAPAGGEAAAAAPAAAPSPGGDTLGDIGRWLAGAIAIIPAIPDWIRTIASAAWLRAREWLLDTFQGIEARVFELRRQVLGFILQTVPEMLREVPAIVAALATMMQWSLHYFALVARIYFEVAVEALTRFVRGIYSQINGVIDTINSVLSLVDSVLDFDLLNLIKPLMGPAGVLIDMIGVRFTLNDLIEVGTGAVNMIMYGTLKAAILAARGAVAAGGHIPLVGRLPFAGRRLTALRRQLSRALGLIDQIVDALFRNTGGPMVETAAPRIRPMPNFYDLLFGAPPAELARHVRDFGVALGTNMRGLLGEVSTTLTGLAAVFTATAADLARTGPARRMARFGSDAGTLANSLYDDQIRALGGRIAATTVGPFERWLAGNGFRIIERAIPLYIGEMRAFWNEREAAGDGPYVEITPTSPHKIARRARLGRVRVPRLTLNARGRAHDETLVRELVERFRDAVRDAYTSGHRQLAQIAAGA
jgi:hypothetical protein